MLNKRGINPLIATVLLIGVTIIIAFVIFAFVRGVSDNQMDDTQGAFDIYSQGVQFSSDAASDGSNTRVLITNEGTGVIYFVVQLDGIDQGEFYEVGEYESRLLLFSFGSEEVTLIPHFFDGEDYIAVSAFTETEEVVEGSFSCSDLEGECSVDDPCSGDFVGEDVGLYGCDVGSCWVCSEGEQTCPGNCDASPDCGSDIVDELVGDFVDCILPNICYECISHTYCDSLNNGFGCSLERSCSYMLQSNVLTDATDCVDDESCWGSCEWDETYALEFDGDGDYVEVMGGSDGYDIGVGSISVSFWAKFDDSVNTEIYVSKGHSAAGCNSSDDRDYGWEVYRSEATNLRFMLCGPGGNRKWTSHQFTVDDQWHNIVSVYDRVSDVAVMYVDGEEVSNVNVGFGSDNVANPNWGLYFGGRAASGGFDGVMDDVRIWNVPFDLNDVAMLYSGEDVLIESLVSWWDFNQGSGTVAYDHIAGGHVGFLRENVSWWHPS
jgi:flagellin-like protein